MTEEQVRQAYLEWIEDYCNNEFDKDDLPGGVELALDQLVKIDPMDFNIKSESIGDLSQTFSSSEGDIPKFIYKWLNPYKRLKSL